jgi:hypothetical protein
VKVLWHVFNLGFLTKLFFFFFLLRQPSGLGASAFLVVGLQVCLTTPSLIKLFTLNFLHLAHLTEEVCGIYAVATLGCPLASVSQSLWRHSGLTTPLYHSLPGTSLPGGAVKIKDVRCALLVPIPEATSGLKCGSTTVLNATLVLMYAHRQGSCALSLWQWHLSLQLTMMIMCHLGHIS